MSDTENTTAPAGAFGDELANPRLYGIAQTIRNTVTPVLEADLARVTAFGVYRPLSVDREG